MRSRVSTSLWMYLHFTPLRPMKSLSSSAMRLVRVVTSTRSSRFTRCLISSSRSSIWFLLGRTSIGGSSRPVGRTTCSTTTPSLRCNS